MSITFNQLKKLITKKEIDTVLVCVSDMQGRLNGKRVTGKAFLDYVYKRQVKSLVKFHVQKKMKLILRLKQLKILITAEYLLICLYFQERN